jgi:hypothetical protein
MTAQHRKNHLGDRNKFLRRCTASTSSTATSTTSNAEDEPEQPDYPKDLPIFQQFFHGCLAVGLLAVVVGATSLELRIWTRAMMCRTRLICRFPARDSRWRTWSPEEASRGAMPFQDAKWPCSGTG